MYDIIFRNEPELQIRLSKENRARMSVILTSVGLVERPLKVREIHHLGIDGYRINNNWEMTFRSTGYVLQPASSAEHIFEFAPDDNSDVKHPDKLPTQFAAALLGIRTNVIYKDHWGFTQQKVFIWRECVV